MSALAQSQVLAFGKQILDCLMPARILGRVFLVGGAYKTLIHGRAPRDLDLFCADSASRDEILAALRTRGARPLRDNPPYQTMLSLGEHVVEVSYDTTQPTLQARLACSDLALSAIGCERSSMEDRAIVHPLAAASLARRQILLLKPLVNWKYALYTLERMHRYAQELAFTLPPEEEACIWQTFTAQAPSERQAMIRRYERVSAGVTAIRERAIALCAAPQEVVA